MNQPNKPCNIYDNAIFVREKKDVPQQEHWAILKFVKMTTPGYDAGDPPDTVTMVQWDAYLEQKDVEAAVKKLETEKYTSADYVVVHISKPASISHKVEIKA